MAPRQISLDPLANGLHALVWSEGNPDRPRDSVRVVSGAVREFERTMLSLDMLQDEDDMPF